MDCYLTDSVFWQRQVRKMCGEEQSMKIIMSIVVTFFWELSVWLCWRYFGHFWKFKLQNFKFKLQINELESERIGHMTGGYCKDWIVLGIKPLPHPHTTCSPSNSFAIKAGGSNLFFTSNTIACGQYSSTLKINLGGELVLSHSCVECVLLTLCLFLREHVCIPNSCIPTRYLLFKTAKCVLLSKEIDYQFTVETSFSFGHQQTLCSKLACLY